MSTAFKSSILFQIILCAFTPAHIFGQVSLPSFTTESDTIHGIIVHDPYKAFEDTTNVKAKEWIHSKNKEALDYLESKPSYKKLYSELDMMYKETPIRSTVPDVNNGLVYAIQTSSEDNVSKIIRMDHNTLENVEEVLTSKEFVIDGTTYEIYDFKPSPDNRYLALQLYPEGLDEMVIRVYDIKSSSFTEDVIDASISYYPYWLPDSKSFFYTQLSVPTDEVSYYDSVSVKQHSLGLPQSTDKTVLSRSSSEVLTYTEGDFPAIRMMADGKTVVCSMAYGISQYVDYYTAPLDEIIKDEDVQWKRITNPDDQIKSVDFSKDKTYLLRAEPDATTSIIYFKNGHPESAQVLVNEKEGFIAEILVRSDAFYYEKISDGISQIVRVDHQTQQRKPIELPFQGNIEFPPSLSLMFNDKGMYFGFTGWNQGFGIYYYDPEENQVQLTDIRPAGKYDRPDDIVVEQVTVYSHDSVEVPLTIIYKKGLSKQGNNPVILEAYGAYGISLEAALDVDYLSWLNKGGILAKAHVRGGGENGPQWHSAGRKEHKPNTWKDLIACSKYLIDQNYTNPGKLGVMGTSAGGIAAGMAINEEPDLFGAAVLTYPSLNPSVCNEEEQYDEFGDPRDSTEFQYLYQMDTYFNMKPKNNYPSVLLIAGKTDQRTPLYAAAKYIARLQEYSDNQALLRVFDTGHGASGDMLTAEIAEVLTFFMSQLEIDI